MTDRKPLTDAKAQKEFDELPLHIRQMLSDEWKRLRERRDPAPDITRGSWF